MKLGKQVSESFIEWSDIRVVTVKSKCTTRIQFSLGPLVFLICINGLSMNVVSTVKLFFNDEMLFSIVHDTPHHMNKDLQTKLNWYMHGKFHLSIKI